jgi:hypothetical protein
MKTKIDTENLVNNSNQSQITKTELETEVYDYVINEVYEGNKSELFTDIVEQSKYGRHYYNRIPDWVSEMELDFSNLIQDDYNDLSMKLWDIETQPYFEKIPDYLTPEDYFGFNKPRDEWSDEELEKSWDYHMEDELHNEIYRQYISILTGSVENYILYKQLVRLREILKTIIPIKELEDKYCVHNETSESNNNVFNYCLETIHYSFRIDVSVNNYSTLEIYIVIDTKEDKDDWYEETIYLLDTSSLDELDKELNVIRTIYKKVIMDK